VEGDDSEALEHLEVAIPELRDMKMQMAWTERSSSFRVLARRLQQPTLTFLTS
jgi:hypothetical protein